MIKVIAGPKGSGKTKAFIEDINQAVSQAKGNVVCIEKSNRLMFDLDKSIRLIDTQEFDLLFCLDEGDEFKIKRSRKLANGNAFVFKQFNLLRLLNLVGCVVDLVFVCVFCFFKIFVDRKVLAVGQGEKQGFLDALVELFVAQSAVFQEDLDIFPEAFVVFAAVVEKRDDFVGNLFGNVL